MMDLDGQVAADLVLYLARHPQVLLEDPVVPASIRL